MQSEIGTYCEENKFLTNLPLFVLIFFEKNLYFIEKIDDSIK